VIQVQEGIAHVLREDRLRINDETLTAHALLIYLVNSAETTFASIGAASDQDIP
jgi:hypothetical protein